VAVALVLRSKLGRGRKKKGNREKKNALKAAREAVTLLKNQNTPEGGKKRHLVGYSNNPVLLSAFPIEKKKGKGNRSLRSRLNAKTH